MPANVSLASRQTAPFDRVYTDVTSRIVSRANKLSSPEKNWLLQLTKTFQAERQLWNARNELEGYRRRWMRLRSRVLWLTAGAFLHISYDLPRAMANDWPGQQPWFPAPDENEGQAVYHGIRDIFDDSFQENASRRTVTGRYAFPFPLLGRKITRALFAITCCIYAAQHGITEESWPSSHTCDNREKRPWH
jgi:hypothetical protein